MTRSVSRQQGGLGQRYGFISVLVSREDIGMEVVGQSTPHMPAPELPSRPASELDVAHTYVQEYVDGFAEVWKHSMGVELGGLYRVGTFSAVVDQGGRGT